ncbi:MAG: hypothetical protein ACLSAF_23120 [Intestinimonas sp.]
MLGLGAYARPGSLFHRRKILGQVALRAGLLDELGNHLWDEKAGQWG